METLYVSGSNGELMFRCDVCGEMTPYDEGEIYETVGFVCNFCEDAADDIALSEAAGECLCVDCEEDCEE